MKNKIKIKKLYTVFPYHYMQMVLGQLCRETIVFMFEKANWYTAWQKKTMPDISLQLIVWWNIQFVWGLINKRNVKHRDKYYIKMLVHPKPLTMMTETYLLLLHLILFLLLQEIKIWVILTLSKLNKTAM